MINDKLRDEYINFLDWWDPYWRSYGNSEDVINIGHSEMLYNLEEIKKDLVKDNDPAFDCTTAIINVNATIRAFKEAGIK